MTTTPVSLFGETGQCSAAKLWIIASVSLYPTLRPWIQSKFFWKQWPNDPPFSWSVQMCVSARDAVLMCNIAELEIHRKWFAIGNCITVSITFILFYTNCLACRTRDLWWSRNWNQCSHFTSVTHKYYSGARANLHSIETIKRKAQHRSCSLSLSLSRCRMQRGIDTHTQTRTRPFTDAFMRHHMMGKRWEASGVWSSPAGGNIFLHVGISCLPGDTKWSRGNGIMGTYAQNMCTRTYHQSSVSFSGLGDPRLGAQRWRTFSCTWSAVHQEAHSSSPIKQALYRLE